MRARQRPLVNRRPARVHGSGPVRRSGGSATRYPLGGAGREGLRVKRVRRHLLEPPGGREGAGPLSRSEEGGGGGPVVAGGERQELRAAGRFPHRAGVPPAPAGSFCSRSPGGSGCRWPGRTVRSEAPGRNACSELRVFLRAAFSFANSRAVVSGVKHVGREPLTVVLLKGRS